MKLKFKMQSGEYVIVKCNHCGTRSTVYRKSPAQVCMRVKCWPVSPYRILLEPLLEINDI